MENPCLDCDAACCGHYAIYMTHRDVLRLARATGRRPATFCAAEYQVLSPHLPAARLSGRDAQLVLASAPGRDACLFQDSATGRCRVHDDAPAICRQYPFEVVDGTFDSLRQRRDVLCPAPFPLDEPARRAMLRDARRFWTRELPAYRRRVAAWNRRRRSPDTLEAFLDAVTRRLPLPL